MIVSYSAWLLFTILIVDWVCASFWDEKRSILHQQSQHTGAARPSGQPHHQGITTGVITTLEKPIKQIHSMSVIYLGKKLY